MDYCFRGSVPIDLHRFSCQLFSYTRGMAHFYLHVIMIIVIQMLQSIFYSVNYYYYNCSRTPKCMVTQRPYYYNYYY